ncbi:MAG: Fructose-bisphosphate aldolase [Verrucomicrobiales bacterium]|nr:Fructose-bisphosphate aldolase [Verrucomicrobiales bacterium]
MESTVEAILAPGKGILAADESFPTIEKRFKALDIPATEETRGAYREMLFTAPDLNEFISGVILFDETLRAKTRDGTPIPEYLNRQGIIPGIKVDKGTSPLPNFENEKMTLGLDGLRERLAEYRALGARFTKWRVTFSISDSTPSPTCIETNAHSLALFAALCQEAGLVPIVEPEILMEGDHSIGRTEEVALHVLKNVFDQLAAHRVVLEHILLKPAMITPGSKCPDQSRLEIIAATTRRCLRRTVPAAVPGIVFLSGGQSDELATQRLAAICHASNVPWRISFSFGRALQTGALQTWKGSAENIITAQNALRQSAKNNSEAILGKVS